MNNAELTLNWKRALDLLYEDPANRLKVDSWFRPLLPYRIDESKGIIYCSSQDSNSFAKNMVNRNQAILRGALFQVIGRDYQVQIIDEKDITPEEHSQVDPFFGEEEYLNPRYSFENFVTGPNNRLAMAACLAIADGYSPEYNPLFLYGDSGLGKTHLLHAIGQYVKKNSPERKVLYVSSEVFTNELIACIKEKKMEEFRSKYRNLDILLIDDIQFIAGKPQTEEEIFHTFEALHRASKQIVFSSDKPPRELGNMPERLITRFGWGMIADIQPPDYETRAAILQQKASQEGFDIDSDMKEVIDLIAQSIPSNIRELEGAFTRVVFQAAALNQKITKNLVKQVLTDVFNTKDQEITPANIKRSVANYFGIKVQEMESSNRSRSIAYPRQVAIYLIRKHTNLSLPRIGEEFGGRDHTTILHSCEKIAKDIKTSESLRTTIENIEKQIL